MRISDVNQDGVGLDGMDPVASTNGEFLKGLEHINSTFENTRYLFANEANMARFEEDPSRYIPMAGNLATGGFQNDVNAGRSDPMTNRALEDEEFDMEEQGAPAFTDEETDVDEEDLAQTNLYEAS